MAKPGFIRHNLMAVLACLLWSSFVMVKHALEHQSPLNLAGMRFVLAGLIQIPLCGSLLAPFRMIREEFGTVLLVSIFHMIYLYGTFFVGMAGVVFISLASKPWNPVGFKEFIISRLEAGKGSLPVARSKSSMSPYTAPAGHDDQCRFHIPSFQKASARIAGSFRDLNREELERFQRCRLITNDGVDSLNESAYVPPRYEKRIQQPAARPAATRWE